MARTAGPVTLAVAALALALSAPVRAQMAGLPAKLGLYDFFVDESTPIVFNGRLLMMESIVQDSPEYVPLVPNCTCYFRVRDQASGVVLVNISSSCGHAFGSAFVATNDAGLDTLFIVGTTWVRMGAPAPPSSSVPAHPSPGTAAAAAVGDARALGWGGPCSAGGANCSIDMFYTSDPALQAWTTVPRVVLPGKTVYNTDVTYVGLPGAARAAAQAAAGAPPTVRRGALPAHEWIMQTEGPGGPRFFVSNASDPTDAAGWQLLDPAVYSMGGSNQVGSCPSIRYDAASGYYYVLTGGRDILLLRSRTLQLGDWQLANANGAINGTILPPNQRDCVPAGAPYAAWYTPSPTAAGHMAACAASPTGYGNDSDADLSEVLLDAAACAGLSTGLAAQAVAALCANVTATGVPGVATLFQFGSGDQATFGFSNLAIAPGGMFDVLPSYFAQ